MKMEIFCVTFGPIKIKTCLAPQNDRLDLSFVKDTYVVVEKMARNGRKTAIYQSQILSISLYLGIYFQIPANIHQLL